YLSPRRVCYLLPSYPILFFSFRVQHHPAPPLFPYTTLFRSGSGRDSWPQKCPAPHPSYTGRSPSAKSGQSRADCSPSARLCPLLDRKSTRLNSSHVSISYAVFCLKQKNKQQLRPKPLSAQQL